ncbi:MULTISPECIES: hypothetical protein [unclassified Exiguobacterium]|uniref:hypothetical protein n=1 Tax=unclassified Exiguobacterium TaxID=2644629 RepID=UPI00103E91AA|nr:MULTISPECIES: hypothetical protein [unclassified Exiguobacterium]TCI25367.1 hypothetical protein EVJ32_10415 [Exiguobacterium sp. SH5S4]TCI56229.1 hypothetical protein EVJ30_04920 [Exiguobacterium sp. SH5S13]TCI61845.1 hypothetical protein EVJ26_09800 [Exiguobacterium sp. SH3S1]
MNSTVHGEQTLESVLTQQDVEKALVSLAARLPEIERSLRRVEDAIDFGHASLMDQAVREKLDVLMDTSNLNIDTWTSAIKLTEKLPLLLTLIEQMEQLFMFMKDAYEDESTRDIVADRLEGYTKPLVEKATETKSIAEEVRRRAMNDTKPISLFMMMKWLKEPSVQQGLRYIQATIEVMSEKTINKK